MADSSMSMPSGMGGLMRFNEEYPSRMQISPEQVFILVGGVVVLVTLVKLFFNF